jgi:hypothetical protein
MEEYFLVTMNESGTVTWVAGKGAIPNGVHINDFCRDGDWHIKAATFDGSNSAWECILARPTALKTTVRIDASQSLDALSTVGVMGQRLHDALERKPK